MGLPGSVLRLPVGTMCEDHPEVLAVKRIQGETDSFGYETIDMCQACVDAHAKHQAERDHSGYCDLCKKHAPKVSPWRDLEEGSSGPVYDACDACIKKNNEYWAGEARRDEEERDSWDDHDDRLDDGPDDEQVEAMNLAVYNGADKEFTGDALAGALPVDAVTESFASLFQTKYEDMPGPFVLSCPRCSNRITLTRAELVKIGTKCVLCAEQCNVVQEDPARVATVMAADKLTEHFEGGIPRGHLFFIAPKVHDWPFPINRNPDLNHPDVPKEPPVVHPVKKDNDK